MGRDRGETSPSAASIRPARLTWPGRGDDGPGQGGAAVADAAVRPRGARGRCRRRGTAPDGARHRKAADRRPGFAEATRLAQDPTAARATPPSPTRPGGAARNACDRPISPCRTTLAESGRSCAAAWRAIASAPFGARGTTGRRPAIDGGWWVVAGSTEGSQPGPDPRPGPQSTLRGWRNHPRRWPRSQEGRPVGAPQLGRPPSAPPVRGSAEARRAPARRPSQPYLGSAEAGAMR